MHCHSGTDVQREEEGPMAQQSPWVSANPDGALTPPANPWRLLPATGFVHLKGPLIPCVPFLSG
jgi:hypothetical protein